MGLNPTTVNCEDVLSMLIMCNQGEVHQLQMLLRCFAISYTSADIPWIIAWSPYFGWPVFGFTNKHILLTSSVIYPHQSCNGELGVANCMVFPPRQPSASHVIPIVPFCFWRNRYLLDWCSDLEYGRCMHLNA
jgi:hypothetical protein